MIKPRIIIFILFINFCLYNNTNAQVYHLQSIDGAKAQIELGYEPSTRTLAIACDRDTIHLVDYIDLGNVKVLGGRFLQVSYAKRAGSNEGLMNTLLLCVYHNKLVQAIHIRSFYEYDMRNIYHVKGSLNEYRLFKIKTQLLGSDKTTYKLNLGVHDEIISERNPKTNHNFNKQLVLSFDPKQNIFYGAHENISKSFKVNDPKTQREIKQVVNSIVPAVSIGNELYYYIKGEWYEKSNSGYLLKYSF